MQPPPPESFIEAKLSCAAIMVAEAETSGLQVFDQIGLEGIDPAQLLRSAKVEWKPNLPFCRFHLLCLFDATF